MALTRRGNGAVQAVTTAAAVPHVAGTLAGETTILLVTGTAAPTDVATWTLLASGNAGGAFTKVFGKVATVNSPADVTVAVTGGTKGWAVIETWSATSGSISLSAVVSLDTDTSSTAFSATGVLDVATSDVILSFLSAFAPSGTYSASPGTNTIAHSAATMGTAVGNFGQRTGTNTIGYASYHRPVTTGANGNVTTSVTMAGANAAGTAAQVRLRETVSNVPPTITADLTTVDAGETVTLTVADTDGTIASVVLSGASPLPSLSGSGGTRTFKALPYSTDQTITATVTDNLGATDAENILIRKSGRFIHNGTAWVPVYAVLS